MGKSSAKSKGTRPKSAAKSSAKPSAKSTATAMRAAGYCRTSGEGQRDNTSIPNQREAIEATCRANGWTLVRVYTDECRSGAKIDGRDEFRQMLADAAAGEFDIVVPYNATRLGRDGVDIVSTAKMLKSVYGIFTVDAGGRFDNRDHRNALGNFVQAGVSEWERLTIMERSIGGRVAKARAGLRWSRNLPWGRTFTPSAGPDGRPSKTSGTWSVSERGRQLAALLVRYADGEPMRALASEYGFPNLNGLLRIIHGSQLAASPYVVTFRSPEIGLDGVRVEVEAVPPVIDAALWGRVLARLAHNKTWNKACLRKYLLSGFLYCGHCGAALTAGTDRRGVTYYRHRCGRDEPRVACPFHSVRGSMVEGPVLDYLYRWFIDQPAFDLAVSLALPSTADREAAARQLREAEREAGRVEAAIARLVDAVAAGADASLLVGRQDALKEERDRLAGRVDDLRRQLAEMPDPTALKEEAEWVRVQLATEHSGKDWRTEDFDAIHRFLHFLFGDHPKREGLGVFVGVIDGAFRADVRARLRLRGPCLLAGEDGYARLFGSGEGEVVKGRPQRHGIDLSQGGPGAGGGPGGVNLPRSTYRAGKVSSPGPYPKYPLPLRASVPLA